MRIIIVRRANGVKEAMKVRRPLVEALEQFVKQKPLSLHVPGHKNGLLSNLPYDIKQALKYDVTELTGLDDLHHPEEAIQEAEQLLAETYGAQKSFMLVNGSTVGNLAMIYATCKRGDKILVQRNAHKSIFHAIELVGAEPVYLMPEWDEATSTMGALQLQTVQQAIGEHPDAKGLIITSPTYYGVVAQDLKQQIEHCHAHNIPVLVDEAHGAHLVASKHFPQSALSLGADVVVQSAHKTLPAMTMASFLHVKSELVDASSIQHYLRMLQSSSPSYMLLASLDEARAYVQSYKESDAIYVLEKRAQWLEALRSIPSVEVIEAADPLKICLRVDRYSGAQVQQALEVQGLYVELADPQQVLLILPLLKVGQSYPFAELRVRVRNAVANLQKLQPERREVTPRLEVQAVSRPQLMNEQVTSGEKEWISYMRAIDRISAAMVIPYPPGVPLFVPGEKITIAKLSQLEDFLAMDASFQGQHQLHNKMIYVMK